MNTKNHLWKVCCVYLQGLSTHVQSSPRYSDNFRPKPWHFLWLVRKQSLRPVEEFIHSKANPLTAACSLRSHSLHWEVWGTHSDRPQPTGLECEHSELINHHEKKWTLPCAWPCHLLSTEKLICLPYLTQVSHHTVIMSLSSWSVIYSQGCTMPNWIQAVLLGLKLQILISQKVMIATQLKKKNNFIKPLHKYMCQVHKQSPGPRQAPGPFCETSNQPVNTKNILIWFEKMQWRHLRGFWKLTNEERLLWQRAHQVKKLISIHIITWDYLVCMTKQVGAKQQDFLIIYRFCLFLIEDLFILYLHVCMCRCVQVIANARRGCQRVSSLGAGVTSGCNPPNMGSRNQVLSL